MINNVGCMHPYLGHWIFFNLIYSLFTFPMNKVRLLIYHSHEHTFEHTQTYLRARSNNFQKPISKSCAIIHFLQTKEEMGKREGTSTLCFTTCELSCLFSTFQKEWTLVLPFGVQMGYRVTLSSHKHRSCKIKRPYKCEERRLQKPIIGMNELRLALIYHCHEHYSHEHTFAHTQKCL